MVNLYGGSVGGATNVFYGGVNLYAGSISSSLFYNFFNWNGGDMSGVNTLSGTANWAGGTLDGKSSLTVANGGLVVFSGQTNFIYGQLINGGTVSWQGSYLDVINGNEQSWNYPYGNGQSYPMWTGEIWNEPGGLWNIQCDQVMDENASVTLPSGFGYGSYFNSPVNFHNAGVLRKSAGTNTFINLYLDNSGTVDAESGILNLTARCNLGNGTLNFGITSLTNFGQASISGSVAFSGTVSASFINGYLPTVGDSFAVLSYGSESGVFGGVLPTSIEWQTNYGSTAFTLSISNIPVTLGFNSTMPLWTTNGFSPMPLWTTNGLNLMLEGPAGSSCVIQASTNLINWVTITNFVITGWPFYFNDPSATNFDQRFYRAVMQ
jgi:hypothetical protein